MEGFYFGTVFRGHLLVSGGLPKKGGITVFRSADGRRFEQAAVLPDWAWVPAVFQDQVYLVGHKGSAYHNGGAAAFRSKDGSRFEPVPALEGVFEYQCAYSWKGQLYLGTGGWTTARKAKNQARIYRYDGMKRELVLADIQMNGITSLAACGRYLFALADSGWETPEGASALYRTANGKDWERVQTFSHPEMRRIVPVNDETLLLLGGKNRDYGVTLRNDTVCRAE